MPRATSVVRAADRQTSTVVDTLILPYAQRQVQKGFLFGVKGTCVELDFAELTRLSTDDALALDTDGVVEIVAEAEPLIEARMNDVAALARLAWSLGDRHVPAQIFERRLRLQRDPAIEEWLRSVGARLAEIEAPFEPESVGAAASTSHHDHDHGHHHHGHHHHGHDHHHHDHGEHHHGHDHGHSHGQHSHDHSHDHGHHHHDHAPHRDKP